MCLGNSPIKPEFVAKIATFQDSVFKKNNISGVIYYVSIKDTQRGYNSNKVKPKST